MALSLSSIFSRESEIERSYRTSVSHARKCYAQKKYKEAIIWLAPAYDEAVRQGRVKELSPEFLKMYFPLPQSRLRTAVEHLPPEIRKLPLNDQAEFILADFAMIHRESKFDPKKENKKTRATGDMQLMPKTGRAFARKLGIRKYDLKNSHDNIVIGSKYHAYLYEKFDGKHNRTMVLASWNWGEGNCLDYLNGFHIRSLKGYIDANITETSRFIKEVQGNLKTYRRLYTDRVIRELKSPIADERPQMAKKIVDPRSVKKEVQYHAARVKIEQAPAIKITLGSYSTPEAAAASPEYQRYSRSHKVQVEPAKADKGVVYRVNVHFSDKKTADIFRNSVPGAWKSS